MAKVVPMRGASPSGWSRERWAWRKGCMADARLGAMTRLVANELAFGYANAETAECSPGIQTLCDAVGGVHRATIMRALAELVDAGWIIRRGGEGPGRRASYAFRTPERVATLRQERVATLQPTCRNPATPPKPPYMDEPNMNQNARVKTPRQMLRGLARPTVLSAMVVIGSYHETAWDAWLADHGHPALHKIGRRIVAGMIEGWDMPWTLPPSPDETMATSIAGRYVAWLRSKA